MDYTTIILLLYSSMYNNEEYSYILICMITIFFYSMTTIFFYSMTTIIFSLYDNILIFVVYVCVRTLFCV
jgi:hypothetical protein